MLPRIIFTRVNAALVRRGMCAVSRSFHMSASLNKFNILISDPIEKICVTTLEDAGYKVDCVDKVPPAKLVEMIKNYHGLIVRSGTQVTKEIIDAGMQLKLIGRAGTGVDNIDVMAATAKGVMVMNTPGGNTVSAAELAFSLMMSLSRNIPAGSNSLKSGKWDRKKLTGAELNGKVLGIIGLGQIGRQMAKYGHGFEMQIIGYDPIMSKDVAAQYGIDLVDLDTLYKLSDIITLHTPLTAETKNLFNEATFAKCKNKMMIINCARGGIIEEQALLNALNSGKCAGAALDVYRQEPPGEESKALLAHERVICTPHLGASTDEAQEKVAKEIASQFVNALEGVKVSGVVNSKILSAMYADKELFPYMDLAERMGSMQAQLLKGKLMKITLRTRGDNLKNKQGLMATAALKGMLSQMVEGPVNYVNAPALAEEFGLRINEVHENFPSLYGSSLTLQFSTTSETKEVVGTVSGGSDLRIVKLNGHPMEIKPEGYHVIFRNIDRPGVIARVTTLLAKLKINVANFTLGRHTKNGPCIASVHVDEKMEDKHLVELANLQDMIDVQLVTFPPFTKLGTATAEGADKPSQRPMNNGCFGSGPTQKHLNYDVKKLTMRSAGRSHRSTLGKAVINECVAKQRALLGIPKDYFIGIIPGSDTGAFEAAMWNMLGPRPVDVLSWESFGSGWVQDCAKELKLDTFNHDAEYGLLPDLTKVNFKNDVIFTWNGTTSGVKVPNGDWIPASREGLTLCDATSAVFSQDLDWSKLDCTTYSWQKALGGEGAHGMMILSPRAVERLNTYQPKWPVPKLFRLTAKGKFSDSIFKGATINTPSLLAIEDCIDACDWADALGGRKALMKRANANLSVIADFVEANDWISFLAKDPASRSNTSVCLSLTCTEQETSSILSLLEREGVAFDIGSYRDAPAGIRIWCGPTVELQDIASLTDWLKWAYQKVVPKKEVF